MRTVTPLAYLAAITMVPSAALGCDRTPDLASLPNETKDEFEKRLSKVENGRDVVREFQREEHIVEHSPVVYVARVVETSRSGKPMDVGVMPWAVVQPVKSIKGELPANARRLTTKKYVGCSTLGDGDAPGDEIGSIVFVFEGLPKTEGRPNGIDSLSASGVLTNELVDGLHGYDSKKP